MPTRCSWLPSSRACAKASPRSTPSSPSRRTSGGLLREATLALGQSGTANEAAAASGVPVVALELAGARRDAWYRRRQRGLLGEALLIVPGDEQSAAAAIGALLADPDRRARMGAAGRERMGGPGGARAIAGAIAGLVAA